MTVMYTIAGYDNVKVKIPEDELCKKLGISKFSLIKFSIKALRYLMKETYGRIKALQITILLEN